MSITVQKANKELQAQLQDLRPSLELLAAQRQPGHSSRIWFYDLMFGSPLELAVVTTLAFTLEARILCRYLPGDKNAIRGALARFLRRNSIKNTATLLRFLVRADVREDLEDLCLVMLCMHANRGVTKHGK